MCLHQSSSKHNYTDVLVAYFLIFTYIPVCYLSLSLSVTHTHTDTHTHTPSSPSPFSLSIAVLSSVSFPCNAACPSTITQNHSSTEVEELLSSGVGGS